MALKEALCSVYWYKSDLRSFVQASVAAPALLAKLNWSNYKRQIVSDLVDALCADQERHLADLTQLCTQLLEFKSFPHLSKLDGGEEKVRRATHAVAQLRDLVEPHTAARDEEAAIKERQKVAAEKLRSNAAVRARLEELKERYQLLAVAGDAQRRGYDLEKLLYDLFELFDLDPKASFKNTGEQIDGAFSLEGTDYLFEARWRNDPSDIGQLDGFASKVTRKLENTLGIFLSINGFSPEGVAAHTKARPNIILMDGADLMAVLEERIDFVVLLLRKRRHAAHTGDIYLRIHQIL
ncbi:MAG: hypothetical protein ACR2NS_04790 [Gemmatimonadaceae bacterium]